MFVTVKSNRYYPLVIKHGNGKSFKFINDFPGKKNIYGVFPSLPRLNTEG
jgi:hypothetical protein